MFVYGLRNETSGPYFKSNNLKVCTPLFFFRDPIPLQYGELQFAFSFQFFSLLCNNSFEIKYFIDNDGYISGLQQFWWII